MLDRWATWAETVVADWPERPADAPADRAGLAATVAQATARARRHDEAAVRR